MAFVSGMFSPVTVTSSVSGAAVSTRAARVTGPTMVLGTVATPRRGFMQIAKNSAASSIDSADDYFAKSVVMQYKGMSCASGVYSVQCAEGSIGGAAEEKRIAALAAQFRERQMSPFQKASALFENRKRAIIAIDHDCDYEEKMMTTYPKLAAAFALGKAEAMRTCARYATPTSIEEEYMAVSVDNQMKARSCPGGVYSSSCQEGTYKGAAEWARVNGLATAFRTTQKTDLQATQERYDMAKFGRTQYGHGCSYEEALFETFPATAAAMRSKSYNY